MPKYKNSGLDDSLGFDDKVNYLESQNYSNKTIVWDIIHASLRMEKRIIDTVESLKAFDKEVYDEILMKFDVNDSGI